MTRQSNRRSFLKLSLAGALLPVAAGCAPGPASSGPATAAPSGPVVTDGAALGTVTLKTLDSWTPEGTPLVAKWITDVNAAFTAKYPNITIDRKSAPFDDINKTLKLTLSGDDSPDVVPANNGWQGVGSFAKAGLIRNLDSYAKAYGWGDRIPATIARQHQATTDGKQIGTGSWFGMPVSQGTFIVVYYNRAKLAKLGLSAPTSIDGLTQAMAAAKAAGEVPMMLGTLDQWLTTTTLFALMTALAPKQALSDFVYGTSGTAADTGMKQAAETYQQWARAGYFPPSYAGTGQVDAGTAFVKGTGVFYVFYSDSLPLTEPAQAEQFGSMVLPSSGPAQATGAAATNLSISTRSAHPDAAALYLDFVSGQPAGEMAVAAGVMPFNGTYAAPAGASPLLADEIGQINAVQATDGFVPYFDWASPTMLDTLGAQAQQLLADRATPDQLVAACQQDYDAFRKTQQ